MKKKKKRFEKGFKKGIHKKSEFLFRFIKNSKLFY